MECEVHCTTSHKILEISATFFSVWKLRENGPRRLSNVKSAFRKAINAVHIESLAIFTYNKDKTCDRCAHAIFFVYQPKLSPRGNE